MQAPVPGPETATGPRAARWVAAAETFARAAREVVRADFARIGGTVERKSRVDFVTETDKRVEALLMKRIREAFPEHAILAEETGHHPGAASVRWLLDPLDGTSNFMRRIPHCAILVAVQARHGAAWRTEAGVILDPLRDECFAATRGGGATLNGHPIRVSHTATVPDGLFATGFSSTRGERPIEQGNHREYAHVNHVSHGVRRFASAGLDLAYVASGRLEGFWEPGLGPWDVAAGGLLVEEAGGRFTTGDDGDVAFGADWTGPLVVATNGRVHADLLQRLAEARDTAV